MISWFSFQQKRFAAEVCKADAPFASELFFSLLSVIATYDPVGWGVPYGGSFTSDIPARQLEMSAQVRTCMSASHMYACGAFEPFLLFSLEPAVHARPAFEKNAAREADVDKLTPPSSPQTTDSGTISELRIIVSCGAAPPPHPLSCQIE